MPFPIALAVGAALGAAKYEQDRKKAERQRETEGTVAAYSPWTGMQAQRVQDPDLLGSVLGGASAGAGMGQSVDAAGASDAMNAKQGGLIDAQTNYYNGLAGSQQQGGYASAPQGGSAGAMGSKNPWMSMNQPYGPQRP